MYLRDTPSAGSGQALRLPALRQAQDRRRGFAPLHTPYLISLLGFLLERARGGHTGEDTPASLRPSASASPSSALSGRCGERAWLC